jgi:hypothetical protein
MMSAGDGIAGNLEAEWGGGYTVAQHKGLSAQKALRMASVAYKLAMPKMD